MALSVRNVGKFANSTCVLLSRTTFIDRDTFQPKTLLKPNFKQYSICNGNSNSSITNINILQRDYRKFQHSVRLKETSINEPNIINGSVRVASITTEKHNDKQLFSENEDSSSNKPSPEQLGHVYNTLADNLPKLFVQPFDYKIYHENMIFEDHIRNIRTVGLYHYIKQVNLLRTIGHIRFAYVQFEILKITQNPEDSSIKIRWRIKGISALKLMLTFWKYKLWDFKKIFEKSDSWYDGFSTFYVNGDGKVVKHVADKMMPDSDEVTESTKDITGTVKLALIVGIIPRFSEFSGFS